MVNDLDSLRIDYVGKQFNWLTVLDVIRNDKSIIMFVCRCKCGNTTTTRKQYVLSGHTTSCGCYKRSKEKSAKYTVWCKNNPDKVAEQGKRHSQWYKDNPDKAAEANEKHKQWFKDNPDKVAEQVIKYKEWCKNNPEKLAEQGKRHSQWYKDNPDKVAEMVLNRKSTIEANPEIQLAAIKKFSKRYLENLFDHSYLSSYEDIIHPDDLAPAMNGIIKKIRTKCPVCGNYAEHRYSNVFYDRVRGIRPDRSLPMCSRCQLTYKSSRYESELADYISSFYDGNCLRNSRKVISPFELDLYYPDKKIAVEFNGNFYHNENHVEQHSRHYNKYIYCKQLGILLVSIFELHWNTNKDDIKRYIFDLFNGQENKLSFNEDKSLMNNNYPSPKCKTEDSFIEEWYTYDNYKVKVYTCGYSKIIKGDQNG